LAGLVHDCAKDLSGKELLQAAEERHLTIDPIDRESPHLLHCSVGAAIAKEKFGIEDEELHSAGRCHTMGKENMTLLEKVLFLADAIEPTRTYDHLDEIRALAYKDFDRALLKTYDGIISFILKKEQLLHPDTAKARNALLMELACQNQIKHKQKNNQ
jgi:predicted HD superfamily hydrolase involved in NAD metabolism